MPTVFANQDDTVTKVLESSDFFLQKSVGGGSVACRAGVPESQPGNRPQVCCCCCCFLISSRQGLTFVFQDQRSLCSRTEMCHVH